MHLCICKLNVLIVSSRMLSLVGFVNAECGVSWMFEKLSRTYVHSPYSASSSVFISYIWMFASGFGMLLTSGLVVLAR